MGRYEKWLKNSAKDHQRAKARHFEKQNTVDTETTANPQQTAIVASVHKNRLTLFHEGEYITCLIASALFSVPFAVGDIVNFTQAGDEYIVDGILPRTNAISRLRGDADRNSSYIKMQHVLAANIDVAVVVAAAAEPAFHPRFIDRYLIACENGGVQPLICINKSDLIDAPDPILEQYRKLQIPVVLTSAVDKSGMDELKAQLKNNVAVFMGQSGVGKSSLVNTLLPDLDLMTQEISAKSARGKHTTTNSYFYQWEDNSYIIDTPGIRSFDLSDIPRDELSYYFSEFLPFTRYCKYSNCLHDHEPNCGVKQAVEQGELSPERYESYTRILHE
jgi:ribosome biogenesis GTPase